MEKKRTSRPAVTAVNRRHFDGNWLRQMSMSWCIPINSASSQRVCTIVLSSTLWVIETSDPWCRRLGLRRCDGCGRNEQFIGLPILVQCENPELESLTPCNTQATGFHGFEHCSDDTWFILHLFLVGWTWLSMISSFSRAFYFGCFILKVPGMPFYVLLGMLV